MGKKRWKFYIWFFQDIFNSHLCSAVINCDQLLKSYEIRQQQINKINNELYYISKGLWNDTAHFNLNKSACYAFQSKV